jgi:hypothetical protein
MRLFGQVMDAMRTGLGAGSPKLEADLRAALLGRTAEPPSASPRRWKLTSYCKCGTDKGHFELSDRGPWVLYGDLLPAETKSAAPLSSAKPKPTTVE